MLSNQSLRRSKPPKKGLNPQIWGNESFGMKSADVTFFHKWSTIFMQKIKEILGLVFEKTASLTNKLTNSNKLTDRPEIIVPSLRGSNMTPKGPFLPHGRQYERLRVYGCKRWVYPLEISFCGKNYAIFKIKLI